MAIKNIVAQGIGFASDGVRWIVTHGFGTGAAPPVTDQPGTAVQVLAQVQSAAQSLTSATALQSLIAVASADQHLTAASADQQLTIIYDAEGGIQPWP